MCKGQELDGMTYPTGQRQDFHSHFSAAPNYDFSWNPPKRQAGCWDTWCCRFQAPRWFDHWSSSTVKIYYVFVILRLYTDLKVEIITYSGMYSRNFSGCWATCFIHMFKQIVKRTESFEVALDAIDLLKGFWKLANGCATSKHFRVQSLGLK